MSRRLLMGVLMLCGCLVAFRPAAPQWEVRVLGTSGLAFGGTLASTADGVIESRQVSGRVPDTLRFAADMFTLSVGTNGEDGTLRVVALHRGRIIKQGSGDGPYGGVIMSVYPSDYDRD